jgi:cytochrome c oxidase cbb3-type subunit III
MKKPREIDDVTGVETTGHEWDGIKELNKPLPRWWVWTFYATIVWAIGYMIAYPAWPTLTGYTKGVLGYSQRQTLADDMQAAQSAQGGMRDLLAKTPLAEVKSNRDLFTFATAAGSSSFQTNCAPCHGRNGHGFTGYPNLNDDDWIWGGTLQEIEKTILFGIRSNHMQARNIQMPRYGVDQLLTPEQIADAAEFVLSLSGRSTEASAVSRGASVFKTQCAACHGEQGRGMPDQGAPNLADGIWLYGGSRSAIVESIRTGRGGAMPAWTGRLDATTLKSLTLYVHSLGGGQ